MVEMTRLNGHQFFVNADLIKHVEATPDTTLSLVTGEKLVVLETCHDLIERIHAWRASLLRSAWPTADAALLARTAQAATTNQN